jgi:hypothetical protein
MLPFLLPLLGQIGAGAAGAGINAMAANRASEANAGRTQELGKRYTKAQKPLTKNILNYLKADPIELTAGLQGRNVSTARGLVAPMLDVLSRTGQTYGDTSIKQAGRGSNFFTKTSLDAANKIGVNPGILISQLLASLQGEDDAAGGLRDTLASRGQEDTDYGRSLRDGSFYKTPTGKQAMENILRAVAPSTSSRGLDALTGVGLGADVGETRGITAFLRNAESNRQYGDRVMQGGDALMSASVNEPFKVRDAIHARLGGILGVGMEFGSNASNAGMNFGNAAAGAGAGAAGQNYGAQLGANLLGTEEVLGMRASQASAAQGLSGIYANLFNGASAGGGSGGAAPQIDLTKLINGVSGLFGSNTFGRNPKLGPGN